MEKILIVESNNMMKLFLANYLGKKHDVVAVDTPEEALKWLKMNQPVLVVADYQKPGSKAHDQLRQVKELTAWTNIPFIVLTDNDKSEQRIHALEIGASDSISKPFNPVELSLRVDSAVNYGQAKLKYRPVA